MTRAQVFQLGLVILLLGGAGYLGFRLFGFNEASAGIASEAVLVLIILAWTASYFFRVITGNMTFIEQRKRYRKAYDEKTNSQLKSRFDSLPQEEQIRLMKELEK